MSTLLNAVADLSATQRAILEQRLRQKRASVAKARITRQSRKRTRLFSHLPSSAFGSCTALLRKAMLTTFLTHCTQRDHLTSRRWSEALMRSAAVMRSCVRPLLFMKDNPFRSSERQRPKTCRSWISVACLKQIGKPSRDNSSRRSRTELLIWNVKRRLGSACYDSSRMNTLSFSRCTTWPATVGPWMCWCAKWRHFTKHFQKGSRRRFRKFYYQYADFAVVATQLVAG